MRKLNLILAVLLASLAGWWPEADPTARAGLALFVLAGTLWITEALPLTYTALIIPVVAAALGLGDVGSLLAGFAHPIIFLFLGGFALAAALSYHEIDHWLATGLLSLAKGQPIAAALLLSLATALLSMWISNTATMAMMLPIALGLIQPLHQGFPRYKLFVLLSLAWGANIGGIATLVGSPPNAIAAAYLQWGFVQWLQVGIPVFIVLFPLALLLLWVMLRPESDVPSLGVGKNRAFPTHREARLTLAIFLLTVTLWMTGTWIGPALGIQGSFDAWVALLALALLGITGTLRWAHVESYVNWGVLLLFGGGITLGAVMQSSGASNFMAEGLSDWLPAGRPWLIYLAIAFFVVFLTELVSNTASAALLVPLFTAVATALGISSQSTAVIIGICASCAFMLPVATPPNALAYGTGLVPQKVMIRCGMYMNLVCVLILGWVLPQLASSL